MMFVPVEEKLNSGSQLILNLFNTQHTLNFYKEFSFLLIFNVFHLFNQVCDLINCEAWRSTQRGTQLIDYTLQVIG